MKPLQHLRELYMLGNPSQSNWPDNGFHEYVVASLPQLELLDGKEIHRSDRIKALQVFSERQRYLHERTAVVRAQKALEAAKAKEEAEAKAQESDVIEVSSHEATDISQSDEKDERVAAETHAQKPAKKSVLQSDEKLPYTPHTRREMYMELAEQKEAEEARKRENQPKERDTEAEHTQALRKARRQEQQDGDGTSLRQCNEGKWEFRLMDEIFDVVLEVDLPRFLDTSLIDVDVHPSYVSIVAKNKLLRLRFPELVHSDAGKAERSKVTGTLRLTLPKAHVSETQKLRAQLQRERQEAKQQKAGATNNSKIRSSSNGESGSNNSSVPRTRITAASTKLSDEVRDRSLFISRRHEAPSHTDTSIAALLLDRFSTLQPPPLLLEVRGQGTTVRNKSLGAAVPRVP